MKRILVAALALSFVGSALLFSQPAAAPIAAQAQKPLPLAMGAIHPRLSPQGDSIVCSYQGAIWRIRVPGGTMERLTDGEGFDIEPAWSPDGERVAYINSRNFFGGELRLGDGARRLPRGLVPVKLPVAVQVQGKLYFHPDGSRVLGDFQLPGKPGGLAWYDLETGATTPVLNPPRSVRRISLSNNGKWIAFATNLDVAGEQGGNDGPQADLWKVSAEGGEPEKIVRFPARIHDTCWAAGDQAIYVSAELGGVHNDLWTIPLADQEHWTRKITYGQADEDRPSISRSGDLLYVDNRHGSTALVLRNRSTNLEQYVQVTAQDFARVSGTLRIRTKYRGTGQPVAARIVVQERGGKFYAPAGSLYRIERGDLHFYGTQSTQFRLPAGTYQIRAYRGPEYRVSRQEFEVRGGENNDVAIELERWTNAAERGWYSGENHIHANYGYGEWYNTPQSMLEQCEGEDLNVCNFMVANSDSDGVFDREFFRGQQDPLSGPQTILWWNQEFRSTIWGHMTLLNLKQIVEPVFTGFRDTTNPWDIPTNSDIADRTHWQNGLVNYTHIGQNAADPYLGAYTGKGLPLDVALGKIDSVDINNSYAGSVPTWYRLLNCGFHLPASAGTDCFLNRIRSRLPGSDRAYVKIDGPFDYKGWIEGLRVGRSFVTNGPMLELSVDEKGLGETIQLADARAVRVVAKATSQFRLEKVELVSNGQVIAEGQISQDGLEAAIDRMIPLDRSGWVALRCSGPANPDHTASEVYAHTSPVYIDMKGKPVVAQADAKFFLAWIDRLAAAIRQRDRIPSPELKAHVEAQIAAARSIYQKLVEAGN